MSVCYYENDTFSQRYLDRYRLINVKIASFRINIINIANIIKFILSDFCDANVIGYEKITNMYWCKIYDKTNCTLHIELEILKHTNDITFVKFIPLLGSELLIENFVYNFTESIQLYTTSSFIRNILKEKYGV